jgi:hypothetical protein
MMNETGCANAAQLQQGSSCSHCLLLPLKEKAGCLEDKATGYTGD